MKKLIGVLLGVFVLYACAYGGAGPQIIARSTDPLWAGSAAHLPVGPGASVGMESPHAVEMPEVKAMLYTYADRGYIRRPDMDVVRLTPSGAVVLMGFEKPGLSTLDGQPVIAVLTSLVGDTPQTDVWGMVLLKTPQGGLTISDSDADQPLDGVIENLGTGPSGPWCHDIMTCAGAIRKAMPPEMREWVDCCSINILAGTVGGGGTPLGVAAGFIAAMTCHGSQSIK